jgi:ribonuclease HI
MCRLEGIAPKLNPTHPIPPYGNLSLTKRRRVQNTMAKENNGEILFDPTITCKENLGECFCIFTNKDKLSNLPAKWHELQGPDSRHQKVTVYTDGACFNNGKVNAWCGSGVWFGPNDRMNMALRIPGKNQLNQVGEIAAIIAATSKTLKFQPLEIVRLKIHHRRSNNSPKQMGRQRMDRSGKRHLFQEGSPPTERKISYCHL